MIDINKLVEETIAEGYERQNAEAKVCQDIILKAISEGHLGHNVTVKGGVVMRSITANIRRATQDIDLDFIRYSLDDNSIQDFIDKLNAIEGIKITIIGKIEELSQQEYRGKRVHIAINDKHGNHINSKIDLGVHVNHDIRQDSYCFDVCLDDHGASLLINSKEQIFAEKLKSLLRFGPLSTRYKDIFDMCYLCDIVEPERLKMYIDTYILADDKMRENDLMAIRLRMKRTFEGRTFRNRIEKAKKTNWLDISIDNAFKKLFDFIETL